MSPLRRAVETALLAYEGVDVNMEVGCTFCFTKALASSGGYTFVPLDSSISDLVMLHVCLKQDWIASATTDHAI
eukprot:7058311-Pyramimonas_sp.AAC.2